MLNNKLKKQDADYFSYHICHNSFDCCHFSRNPVFHCGTEDCATKKLESQTDDSVDLGFGDYWQAPLTESHYLCAVDMPENASVGSRDNDNIYEGLVQHLWVAEDSILVACYSSGNDYALYAFHSHDSSIDTLLHRADSLQFANALQNRNIDVKTALTPDEYFNRAQREAHKIESPVRHTVVIVIILAFWAALLWLIKKNSSS